MAWTCPCGTSNGDDLRVCRKCARPLFQAMQPVQSSAPTIQQALQNQRLERQQPQQQLASTGCPRCGSQNTQASMMAVSQGTSHSYGVSRVGIGGVGVGTGGIGVGVGKGSLKTRTMTMTQTARALLPVEPEFPTWTVIICGIVGISTIASIISQPNGGSLVVLLIFAGWMTFSLRKYYGRLSRYKENMEFFRASWLCLQCGMTFEPVHNGSGWR